MSDYTKDGILYCGNCNTEKAVSLMLDGKKRSVRVVCKCEYEKSAQEEAELKKRMRFTEAMQNAGVYELNLPGVHCNDKVKRYIDNFERLSAQGTGLLLWGDVGTGKSESAAYVCRELKNKQTPCIMTNFASLVSLDSEPKLGKYDLVVFDDLGAERQSDFMLEGVFKLIDDRVNRKKPMIVTTNLDLAQMKEAKEIRYKRLYDRILSVCVPIRFAGESYRKAKQNSNLKLAQELFL